MYCRRLRREAGRRGASPDRDVRGVTGSRRLSRQTCRAGREHGRASRGRLSMCRARPSSPVALCRGAWRRCRRTMAPRLRPRARRGRCRRLPSSRGGGGNADPKRCRLHAASRPREVSPPTTNRASVDDGDSVSDGASCFDDRLFFCPTRAAARLARRSACSRARPRRTRPRPSTRARGRWRDQRGATNLPNSEGREA